MPYYNDSQTSIPDSAITIFTLFHLMAYDLLNSETFVIEREGLNYNASLIKMHSKDNINKYKLDLLANPLTDSIGVLEHTDLFTWAVFKKNANRLIWVNVAEKRIEKCNFNVGFFTLTAQYLSTDE